MMKIPQRYKRSRNGGIVSGIMAVIFGVFGILSIGALFVPIAALFTFISLARSITHMSRTGFIMALFGALTTAMGFATSPSLWVAIAAATKQ